MLVPPYVWAVTVIAIVALLAYDFFAHVRKAHEPSLGEAARWSALYVGIALAFGVGVWVLGGAEAGQEYFAGYLTEKALSVDNLFVFLILMTAFAVPRLYQQKVLLFGIAIALLARTGFIFAGAALVNRFAWVFYLFGLILFATGAHMLFNDGEKEADNIAVRVSKRLLRTTDHYDGDRLTTHEGGRRRFTPMVLVMAAIGGTDILFALDSIPAIYGLTQDVYLVFTATAFSLLGLRQLYFLIDGLLDRLVYLSYGLAAILAFIGAKLVLHALHENTVPFINGGRPVPVWEIPTTLSLGVIVGGLAVTVVASLLRRRPEAPELTDGSDEASPSTSAPRG
ncbi:MAG TPA: TerC family protein [Propionibacteriaceae bacterium]|nr:TerC family protein [Propionibacteriaceae bacterium]